MKKVILSIAVLAALSTTSCKKAYECSCEETQSSSYEAVMTDQNTKDDVAYRNANEATYQANYPTSDKTVYTIDKTSKADANTSCSSYENVNTYLNEDNYDNDGDNNYDEIAYKEIATDKVSCSLKKK